MNFVVKSLRHSFDGFAYSLRSQRKVRLTLIALAAALPFSLLLAGGPWQWAALIGSILLSLSVELINSCAEELCDHVTPERHPDIKAIKDMGSAAVFSVHMIGLLVWGAAIANKFGFG